jgi:hypothetical protein
MFFHVADQPQENYPFHWQLGSFSVSTDPGWKLQQVGTAQVLYKGYADRAELENLLMDIVLQTTPRILGNFCALVLVDNTLSIQTDCYRSFPIYISDREVNNLIATDRTAWADSLITVHTDFAVTEHKFDVIGNAQLPESTVDQIDELLTNKIQAFLSHNQLPLRVFLSGGVDTLLIYSYLRKFNAKYELVQYLHTELDHFYLCNSSDLKKYWAYNQIHHWKESCVLVSGTPGDEFMLRNPLTGNQYLLNHGTNIPDQLVVHPNCLHHTHFSKNLNKFKNQPSATDWELCNITVNDWQHWHLGNTLTWTPLRDLELFKLCLALPYELALAQIMNSTVSQQLIERNVPGLTKALSDQKNSGNGLRNLQNLFAEHT